MSLVPCHVCGNELPTQISPLNYCAVCGTPVEFTSNQGQTREIIELARTWNGTTKEFCDKVGLSNSVSGHLFRNWLWPLDIVLWPIELFYTIGGIGSKRAEELDRVRKTWKGE